MFQLDLPNIYEVINNGKVTLDERYTAGRPSSSGASSVQDVRNQQIVVVSVFGATWSETLRGSKFKRAFQLSLDAFGTLSLFNRNVSSGDDRKRTEAADGGNINEQSKIDTENEFGGDTAGVSDSLFGKLEKLKLNENENRSDSKAQQVENEKDSGNASNSAFANGGILEGFFNEDESVLFLHIEGLVYNGSSWMRACQELRSKKESGLLSLFSAFNTSYCKWLILLFSMSHILILSETGCCFDTGYVSLFRALDSIRLDLLSSVARILSRLEGLPRQWIDHARLCSPRLLFLFEVETENPAKIHNISSVTSCPVKERKEMLQNEIYQIFRKCRIITNISANSLFAIPATGDFVYVFDKSAQNTFSTNQSLAYTYLDIISISTKKANSKLVGSTASRTSSSTSLPIKMSFRAHQDTLTYNDSVNSFRNFLMDHILVAHDRGFDDDYRRVSGNKHFFVRPTFGQWEAAYNKLHQKLIAKPVNERIGEIFFQMQKLTNVDSEYLEIQCAELFPKVYATYQRGLPEFYTAHQHQNKLAYAVNLFLSIARGSGVLPWLTKLASKCEKYWKNGRQQCETLSLLGHVCANPVHKVRRLDHLEIIPLPEMEDRLPEMQHSSSSRLVSYCNCGRRQGSREEPFTIRDANYNFYKKLAKDCCDKLEKYNFAVFTPIEGNNSELTLQEMLTILQKKTVSGPPLQNLQERLDDDNQHNVDTPDVPEVFESELRQEDGLDEDESESEDEEELETVNDGTDTGKDGSQHENPNLYGLDNPATLKSKRESPSIDYPHRSMFKRTSSTIEYLPGMFHSKSPTGLLTLFPSWSLVCLGPSSIYSHSHGVNQPGFLNGANSLLPWDVKVKAEEGVTYIPPARVFRGRRHNSRAKTSLLASTGPTNEFVVKVFFGFEYECRKGHRFFCDSNSVLYVLNYSIASQKTIAGKVIAGDMPLYAYCPCKETREGKQIAQLVRIHVVTPKAPVFVTMNPKVQPGPMGTCPIFLTGDGPIKLSPSTYWILRLPFSYVGEVVYVPPTDVARYNGKALKGTFDVVSMSPSETEDWEKQNQARLL